MKYLETVFSLLFTASAVSTVILFILLLIRKLFQKHLKPRVIHILWFIVLIKLLVPIAPQSQLSLFNVLPKTFPLEWNSVQKSTQLTPFTKIGTDTEINSNDMDINKQPPKFITNQADETESSVPTRSSQDHISESTDGMTWLSIGSLVWLIGLLCLGGYYLFSALIFRKIVGNSVKIEEAEVLMALEACKQKLIIKKEYTSMKQAIFVALVFMVYGGRGFICPRILARSPIQTS